VTLSKATVTLTTTNANVTFGNTVSDSETRNLTIDLPMATPTVEFGGLVVTPMD
jgi:hypothetical protein